MAAHLQENLTWHAQHLLSFDSKWHTTAGRQRRVGSRRNSKHLQDNILYYTLQFIIELNKTQADPRLRKPVSQGQTIQAPASCPMRGQRTSTRNLRKWMVELLAQTHWADSGSLSHGKRGWQRLVSSDTTSQFPSCILAAGGRGVVKIC